MESVNKSGWWAATDTTLYTAVMKVETIRPRISNYSFTRPYIKSKQSGEVDSDTNIRIQPPLPSRELSKYSSRYSWLKLQAL